ncbi:MAG TPA: amino acid adenylation domain-containing protein [Edaphobacter sp.]|nr:amino acid adenylation domain-containing protein [Edaphobacter sp.]
MLNVSFQQNGTQKYIAGRAKVPLPVHDLRSLSKPDREDYLLALRDKLSHRLMHAETGETFDVQLSLLPGGAHRLHTNIDLLIADAASYSLLLEDLSDLVTSRILPSADQTYDFRSYLAYREMSEKEPRERAQAHWKEKIYTLPSAPALPLATAPETIGSPKITRRYMRLASSEWKRFRSLAGSCGLTAPMALATCYSAVLGRWSGQQQLLLNLTLFDRQSSHPAVDRMIADFTNILLLEMACPDSSFRDAALRNQDAFATSYEHASYSGVEVMRDLKKHGRHPHGAPIVFTSNIGRPMLADNIRPILGELGWGISQTPQVWIDHQALEDQDSLLLQWDSNDELFAPGLIDTLFHAYVELVRFLADNSHAWYAPLPDLMPTDQRAIRRDVNDTHGPIPTGLLHHDFFRQAESTPNAVAIIDAERNLSYEDLSTLARRLACSLQKSQVKPGDLVAVSMARGIGQIISVLGILYTGAIYVPVSLEQPTQRREQIYENAGISAVIVCATERDQHDPTSQRPLVCWQEMTMCSVPLADGVTVSNQQAAYVIYTSGSTGVPKGVVISHEGALNTCLDVTRRYGICNTDRTLALSALHFDLSVYDIFGVLGAGGALVLLNEAQRRDPETWCNLIQRHHVTVWNSVPALFDMLLTYSEGFGLSSPSSLRVVMLSGDWIGLSLPSRYRAFRKDGLLMAMGGATEAAIWSNFFEVDEVQAEWRSIPYGYPLLNQQFRVVDDLGRDCPDWCPGELWIGGTGVALGYHNDELRTRQQFVEHHGGRWYRTGDLGCYWPDGTLEFLGRRDRQVKVGGYRIELGEIDAALNSLEGISSAVTIAIGDRDKSLACFVVSGGDAFTRTVTADPALPKNFKSIFDSEDSADVPGPVPQIHAERLVCDFLRQHLVLEGIDFLRPMSLQMCMEQYHVAPVHRVLTNRWLDLLESHEILHRDTELRYQRGPEYDRAAWTPAVTDDLYPVHEALLSHHTTLSSIVRGQRPVETLFDHSFWSPEALQLRLPGAQAFLESLADAITRLSATLKRPVKLFEIGSRSGLAAAQLLERVDPNKLHCTLLDESAEMVLRSRSRFQGRKNVSARRWDATVLREHRHQADVVWANNCLHRVPSPDNALADMLALAAPGAMLLVHELAAAPALTLVSVDLFAAEASRPADRLQDKSSWVRLFDTRSLSCDIADSMGALNRFVMRADRSVAVQDPNELRAALASKLPAYMLPQRCYFLETMPLNTNGKIDHKTLAGYLAPESHADPAAIEGPRTPKEEVLFRLWGALLGVSPPHRNAGFFELGGDSLLATRLIGALSCEGYVSQLSDLFAYPNLSAFAATLQVGAPDQGEALAHDQDSRYKPFPLTEVQQAYLVGRSSAFALGGVGSHFFMEFAVQNLDLRHFEASWNQLIARHDMLRAVVRNGKQLVLRDVDRFSIKTHDLAEVYSSDGDAIRDRLAHKVLDPAIWPVFSVEIAQDKSPTSRVFVGLDNLLLDGMSMQIVMDELTKIYLDPGVELPPIEIGFRDYLVNQVDKPESAPSTAYWQRRLADLPPGPQLPLRCDPNDVRRPRFIRLDHRLSSPMWSSLRSRANAIQLTPSALLLAAYASVLSAWSARPDLSLNVTFFDRKPVHPHIHRVVGDFTSLFVLAWRPDETWAASASSLQQRLQQDMNHRDVSAIQIMRRLTKERGVPTQFPVVFTSALGYERGLGLLSRSSWLKPVWGISQTPQVWLDHQVYESDGELVLNWDAATELFESEVLEAMFGQYTSLLSRLSTDDSTWEMRHDELLPRSQRKDQVSNELPVTPIGQKHSPGDSSDVLEHICRLFEYEVKPITARQNFFEAGASSLDLVRLHVRLTQAGYPNLAVTDLFTCPSPVALAERLSGSRPTLPPATDSKRRTLLEQRSERRLRRGSLAVQIED